MDNTQKAELAEKIAEVIEQRGLCHRAYEDQGGSVCLLGAGRIAQGNDVNDVVSPNVDALTAKVLGFDGPHIVMIVNDGATPVDKVLVWNPEVGLTKQGAIDLAMSAAKLWRNKG